MKKFKAGRVNLGWLKNVAAFAIAAGVFWMTALTVLAVEGEITAATAYIRAQASTESDVVGSTVKGKKVDLLESVKDSGGTTWYKVSVAGGGYGYIRGDLVKASGEVPAGSTASTSSQTTQPADSTSQPAETVPTAIGEQAAVIQCETNAIVRSGASKSHSVVSSLPNGTAITLIGEANDNAGNKWYQLKADYNSRTIEGYVRSDLIAIGAQGADNPSEGEGGGEAPAEGENPEGGEGENPEGEGQAPEETAPEPEPDNSHKDYEIRWAQNQDNEEYDYFLYDNQTGTRMRLSEVLNAATSSSEYTQKLQDKVDKNKILIIVLAGVIVLLFIIITIMIFKIRSLYYEDYDEDEEEEEEEEPEPVPVRRKVRRKVEEEEEPVPVRKKRPVPKDEEAGRSGERPVRPKRAAEPEVRAAEKKEGVKKSPARKSQNFLVDDDEFEFEFLNMDDKDV